MVNSWCNFVCCISSGKNKNATNKKKAGSSFKKLLEKTPQPSNTPFRSRAASNANQLPESQKELIKLTWKEATAHCKYQPGIEIFQHIFRRCPELKVIFSLDHIENLEDLPKDKNFIRHAQVFSSVIDLAVRNLDELHSQMAPALITLGRRHFYKHQVGFRPEYMAVFASAMMDFVLEHINQSSINQEEAAEAWWTITTYLVAKLKQGYELESMNKGKHRLNWPHGHENK